MNGERVFPRLVVYVLLLIAGSGIAQAGEEESLQELITRVGRARWTFDNSIDLLADPRDAWQARVDLTQNARHHVFISTFSWHNDTSGQEFRDILISSLKDRKAEEIDLDLRVLVDASALFARNHFTMFQAFWDKETGKPEFDEEIGDAIRLTKGGEVVNERLQGA